MSGRGAGAQVAKDEIRLPLDSFDFKGAGVAGAGTSGLAGIRTIVLKGDPTKPGLYTILLRVPAHTKIAAHRHPDDRIATVVSGTWYFGYGRTFDDASLRALPVGSFYTEPPGKDHFAETRESEVLVQITGVGPTGTQYVNPASAPSSSSAPQLQKDPVVLVGHSYGGAVITGAAAGNANVKALVYVAAMAPDAGEPAGAFFEKYPAALGAALRPDAAGFMYIDRSQFHSVFAADVPLEQARVMSATQRPIKGSVFGEAPSAAAWKSIPSWYLVARDDKSINPDLERFYVKRMSAHTTEISSSHVPFLSHTSEVVRMIEQAARSEEAARTTVAGQ